MHQSSEWTAFLYNEEINEKSSYYCKKKHWIQGKAEEFR